MFFFTNLISKLFWYFIDESIYLYLLWKDLVFPLPLSNNIQQPYNITDLILHFNDNTTLNIKNIIETFKYKIHPKDILFENNGKFIEIIYKNEVNKYRILCKTGESIIIKNNQLHLTYNTNNNEHNNKIKYVKGILMAELNDKDITVLIQQLAGPEIDFHNSCNQNILTPNDIYHLLNKNNKNNTSNDDIKLVITDTYGDDYIFMNDDKIFL